MKKVKMFDNIDKALQNRKESELYLIYTGIFLVIASISYLYIYPASDRMLKKSRRDLAQVQTKIAREENYIKSKSINGDSKIYIQKIRNGIKKQEHRLEDTIYANGYIDTKLRELSYLLYSDVNWANFIDNIAKDAKRYNVEINYIKNKFNKLNYQKVEQALDIEVDANGNFRNLMKFVNSVEKSKLVVDVYKMRMGIGKKSINLNFKVAVWGIKY